MVVEIGMAAGTSKSSHLDQHGGIEREHSGNSLSHETSKSVPSFIPTYLL